MKKHVHIGAFKVIDGVFYLVLPIDITVVDMFVPADVKEVVHILQIERDTLKSVGNLGANRLKFNAPHLLEIGELRYFRAVPPHFPSESGGTECRRFPVIFDKADVVFARRDAEVIEALKIERQHVFRCGFQDYLILVIRPESEGVLGVSAIGWPAHGFYVGDLPRFWAEASQKSGGVKGACTDFNVVGLLDDAPVIRPKFF